MQTMSFPLLHFDLNKIALSGQVFRWEMLGPSFWLMQSGEYAATARQAENTLFLTCPASQLPFWKRYLTPDEDYDGFWACIGRHVATDGEEAYLSRAARAGDGIRILRQELFETAVSFLISQNNNIPRIRKILSNLCRTLGQPLSPEQSPMKRQLYAFPSPEALCDTARLRSLGLGYRDRYVAQTASHFAQDCAAWESLREADCEEARARLLTLPGVGPKVADCILLFGLCKLEAFPRDVWIRRVLAREFPQGFPYERYPGFSGFVQQLIYFFEREQQGSLHQKGG